MPEVATAGPSGGATTDPSKAEVFKYAIYDACLSEGDPAKLWSQEDLLDLDIIPNRDAILLLKTLQSLTNEKLFIVVSLQGGALAWRWRSREDANKYKQCQTDEQRLVYGLIDEAGGDGIWTRTIMGRLSMNDAVMKTAVKQLINKGLIQQFKNVEHPNKKMYIKSSMRPSERATGGPWFTDQLLDEAFIEDMQRVIYDYVKRQSTHHQKAELAPKKGVLRGEPPSTAAGKKRSAGEMSASDNGTANGAASTSTKTGGGHTSTSTTSKLLPLPAGFIEYPTVRDIARFISQSGITSDTILGEEDVQKLIDVLIFDGLIEPVRIPGSRGFRVCRVARQSLDAWFSRGATEDDGSGIEKGLPEPYPSAYTATPCGRCPVFDLCEEGGPVSASNCKYFQEWLGAEEL